MEVSALYEVVTRTIGPIDPIGETNADNERLKNLELMTGLLDMLLTDIDDMIHINNDHHEYSRKRAAKAAKKFLDQIGIEK